MNMSEAKRLLKSYEESVERTYEWDKIIRQSPTNVISINGTLLDITDNEYRMICNILDNTIREREQNLRERIANELNIDIEA